MSWLWEIGVPRPVLMSSSVDNRPPHVRTNTTVVGKIILSPNMGVSENSVPLNPMVNDHYPY